MSGPPLMARASSQPGAHVHGAGPAHAVAFWSGEGVIPYRAVGAVRVHGPTGSRARLKAVQTASAGAGTTEEYRLMSFTEPEGRHRTGRPTGGVHVPAGAGVRTWFNGDIYGVRLTAEQTGGMLGVIEATVPPGGGPAPHVHAATDETFYMVDGELEFLDGDRVFTARTGDVVHIPRGTTHRFVNAGILPAKLVFVYTPGGAEGLFVEGGDQPQAGVQVQPWGPERIDDRMLGLLQKYDTGLPPAAA